MAAAALRPTGPAAAAASAPIVNFPLKSPSTLFLVMNTSTTSVPCTPACQPTLPPVSVTNCGKLHAPSAAHHHHAVSATNAGDESDLDHVGNDCHALCLGQQCAWQFAGPDGHDFVQRLIGRPHGHFGISFGSSVQADQAARK